MSEDYFFIHFFILSFPQNPMQLVAPRAVSTAEIIDAIICSVHFIVSFLVIHFSFFYFGTDFTDSHSFFSFSAVSLWRSPRVWRQSTVACDFTLGPDPSKQFKAR
jgi:hypothetical protein